MSRLVLAVTSVLLSPAVLWAAPMPQEVQKGALPYPAKAPLVVCLNGYDTARDRLAKFLTAAVPNDAPKITKLLDDQLGRFFQDRKLTAVRKNARAYLVVSDLANLFDDETPPVVLVVPITAYKDFRESFLTREELKTLDQGRDGVDAIKTAQFGEEVPAFLVDLKDHVALSLDKASADIFAGKFTAATLDALGSELSESFLKADLAVYVNMDSINDQFGDQIRAFKGLIDFGLQQAIQQGALPGFSKKQMDALKVIMKGGFQAVEDCRAIVAAIEFRPDGLAFKVHTRFAENTESAKFVAREHPGPLAEVDRLPAGLGIYGGTKLGPSLNEILREIGQEFSTTEEDIQGARLIEMHLKDLAASGHRSDFSATTAPGTSITVTNYKDPEKAARALTKTYKAIAAGGKANAMVLKTAPRVSDEAEKHGGFTFSEVRVNYDFEATVAGLPDQARDATLQSLKRAANERTVMWIGSDGKVVVHLIAKDWDSARGLLEQYLQSKGTVGADPAYKFTRGQLPAEASYLLIAETGSAITTMLDSVRGAAEAVPGFPRIPVLKPVKGDPTYVGLAITLKDDTATLSAFIPASAVGAARKILEPLFKTIE